MTKAKMKSFARDVKESNKNLKGDKHKTLDKYGTPRTVLLLRGKYVTSHQYATIKGKV